MPTEHPIPRVFTLDEAVSVFPRVKALTDRAVSAAAVVEAQLVAVKESAERRKELEAEYADTVRGWAQDVMRLGCEVKGLWLVDFDNGEGYYCWRYPEARLEYCHDYASGFTGRTKIV